jgi:phospholipid-binding lipoprotein MlaA
MIKRLVAVAAAMAAISGAAVAAEGMQGPPSVRPAETQDGALAGFNSYMHHFNLWVWQTADATGGWPEVLTPPEHLRDAAGNLLLNFINEPVSMVSWAVAGDFDNAAVSAQRFWVNTTEGWLGVQDVATSRGILKPQIDIGLAFCARGVGEGGYIVLPFVGPRTVRDGLADFLLTNAITYAALSPVVGFPPSLESIAVIEVAEEAGRIGVMRQIDHGEDRNTSLEDARDKYLAERRRRCDEIIAGLANTKRRSEVSGGAVQSETTR